ncbi:MAG: fused MFS/spermidine synthase [Deltaproteobacteria bacterium]|nr:fused MFS/spermidine synthase [Deltaproteobacteria bacterium]
MSRLLWLCFGLSGAAALAFEMLWMRSAGLVLGTTVPTTATVLACYFAGLGLGAACARQVSSRPVRLYSGLECGAGAGGLWSLGVFSLLAHDTAQVWLSTAGTAGRVAAVALAILPTTLCLGATLPALGQALASVETIGRRGGLLYAINTLGGVLGAAAAGFGLPALVGVRASYGIAAGISLLAGLLALVIGDRHAMTEVTEPSRDKAVASTPRGRLRLVAAGTGALGLGLEVLWTRLFAQVLHNSVYSFTAVALVFLLAIAMGAALAASLLPRTAPTTLAATALVTAAGGTIGGLWLFVYWTDGLAYIGMRTGLVEYLLRITALAMMTIGPTAAASGIVLPALWTAWGDRTSVAHPLGDLSAANLFGGVFGAIVTGFVIIPTLGVRGSLLVAAVVYILLADLLAAPQGRLRPLAYAVLLAIVIANPMRAPLVHLRPEGETLRDLVEGVSGIVTVVDADGDLQLRLDNYYVLGGSAAATNERRQGLLPLLLHPNPHRVAFIGLATGISASAGPALGVEETIAIELVPEVATMARTYFAPWNAQLLERPDVRLVLDDGRRALAANREAFDVIVSDLFIPWHAGTGNLYAREMYDTVARRLTADGLFCQWLPLYQLTREEFDIIVHTFLTVFPQVSLWRDDFYPDRPVVGLVGQLTPRALDLTRIRERLLHLPDWSTDPLLSSPRGLIMLYAGNLTAAADLFAAAPSNTDDRPLIEFLAPRLTRVTAAGDQDWFTGETLAAFYDTLETRLAGVPDLLLPGSDETAAARRAGTALYHYALAAARHEDVLAARFQTEVRELVPEVILAAEAGSPKTSLAEAQQDLVGLRREQEAVQHRLEDMEQRLRKLSGPEENTH